MNEQLFPILIASKMSGLSVDLIRAWERRYQAVTPCRAREVRMYSLHDVMRLKTLKQLTERGQAIRFLAKLSDSALQQMIEQTQPLAQKTHAPRPDLPLYDSQKAALFAAIQTFDAPKLSALFTRLSVVHAPREFIYEIVLPFLHDVGAMWQRAELSISHEHFASKILRDIFGSLQHATSAPQPRSTHILLATPEGEPHEFGLLCAAIIAQSLGAQTTYLGLHVPTSDLIHSAHILKPQIVTLSLQDSFSTQVGQHVVKTLEAGLPLDCQLWLGGSLSLKTKRAVWIKDLKTFEERVQTLLAH